MIKIFFSLLFCILFSTSAISGTQDLLIKLLIKKGILTKEEAKMILEEAKKEEEERRRLRSSVEKVITEKKKVTEALKGIKFGFLTYIDYSDGQAPLSGNNEYGYSRFKITRGYFTVKKKFLPWLSARMTIDTHIDEQGDYEYRLKYFYTELRPPDLGFLTDMKAEIGLGHIPWLDFEEHVNPYRMQGTMAIERAGVFNSADTGISIRGYFGGKIEDAKSLLGNTHYAGRYGSWHIGIYNGSGYHEAEKNKDKVIEGRITFRPFPESFPGLQLSYFGLYGEGNRKTEQGDYPDYRVNLFMLSYQSPSFIFTGQYFRTKGNSKGTWIDRNGDPLKTEGFSFFIDYRLFIKRLHIFARYDFFDQDRDDQIASDTAYQMYVFGLAYDVYRENKVLFCFEKTDYEENAGKKGDIPRIGNNLGDDYRIQAVWQIKF